MRLLRQWLLRLRTTMTRRHDEARLREEIDDHLAFEMEANLRRGLPPAEARRRYQCGRWLRSLAAAGRVCVDRFDIEDAFGRPRSPHSTDRRPNSPTPTKPVHVRNIPTASGVPK